MSHYSGSTSFDSYTRLDAVLSSRHALTGGVIYFPRRISNATLSTFRPPEATPKFTQEGFSAGAVDRLILNDRMVLESTVAVRSFEVDQSDTAARSRHGLRAAEAERHLLQQPGAQRPQSAGRQRAHLRTGPLALGQHVFKAGVDMQRSSFDGLSTSSGLDVVRLDGSLAERTTYRGVVPEQDVAGTELAVFAQDRWRVTTVSASSSAFAQTVRPITDKMNFSPRAGVAFSVLPRTGHRARRAWQIRRALTADRRCLHAVPKSRRYPLRRHGRGIWNPDHLCTRDRRRAAQSGEHRPDRGVGSAIWPQVFFKAA